LRRPDTDDVAPSYLELHLGRTAYLGVQTVGILEGKKVARSYVRFDVPMRAGERPRSLGVVLDALDKEGTDLKIKVNGITLTERRLEFGIYSETLLLDDLVAGEPVRIELWGRPQTLDTESEWTFGKVEMRLRR
jgi:hypothetical protein